jgi:hypothetical protein
MFEARGQMKQECCKNSGGEFSSRMSFTGDFDLKVRLSGLVLRCLVPPWIGISVRHTRLLTLKVFELYHINWYFELLFPTKF